MTEDCPVCGNKASDVTHETNHKAVYRYVCKDYVIENNECLCCNHCGFSWYGPGMIERNNERFHELERQVIPDGVTPNNLLRIREVYDWSLTTAGEHFDVTRDVWKQWELGLTAPEGDVRTKLKLKIESLPQ